ncbi:hypothetical protein PUN28_018049 [Cardiocondyla obscurior]|uniref:Uncharacterized protein n=1 Tax=Cardiocondyla obscurior TaxID=286306 RepID=A0AAW2ELF9_9HYME
MWLLGRRIPETRSDAGTLRIYSHRRTRVRVCILGSIPSCMRVHAYSYCAEGWLVTSHLRGGAGPGGILHRRILSVSRLCIRLVLPRRKKHTKRKEREREREIESERKKKRERGKEEMCAFVVARKKKKKTRHTRAPFSRAYVKFAKFARARPSGAAVVMLSINARKRLYLQEYKFPLLPAKYLIHKVQ